VIYARRNESGLIEMRAADLENDTEAVLSPDGRAVVYSRGVSHFNMNLQLLPLLTSENGLPRVAGVPMQLTEGRGQWHVHKGAWSPDGRSLVYTRDADRADIFVIENYR
jgi:hypothetical protein